MLYLSDFSSPFLSCQFSARLTAFSVKHLCDNKCEEGWDVSQGTGAKLEKQSVAPIFFQISLHGEKCAADFYKKGQT